MAYSWEEIKYLGEEWWKSVPFKERVARALPGTFNVLRMAFGRAMPIIALTAVKAARLAGMNGLSALNFQFWWVNLQAAIGWVLGWGLANLDNVFYAVTCNSREETCQRVKREIDLKRWKSAWRILEMTAGEREQMPVRNVVTLFVVGVMGVWLMTSTVSIVALGMCFGLGARLILELWQLKRWQKWYWIIKREFTLVEHRVVVLVLSGMLVYQMLGIVRL